MFSIVTPLFNKAAYFAETAESVLCQEFAAWEWIIVDDGSTDGSDEIAGRLSHTDSRVKLIKQKNSGPCTARNVGVGAASHPWLLFLDGDDLLHPQALKTWNTIIEVDTKTQIHAAGWHEMSPDAANLIALHLPAGLGNPQFEQSLKDSAIAFAPWHPSAAVVRRECVSGEFLWPEEMNRMVTEDTVFWWRLITRYSVATHDMYAVLYRRGTPGCRDQFRDPVRWSRGLFHALDSNIQFWVESGHCLTPGQIASLVRVYENFGQEAIEAGEVAIADESFHQADKLVATNIWKSHAALARRMLGTKNFQKLRKLLKLKRTGN